LEYEAEAEPEYEEEEENIAPDVTPPDIRLSGAVQVEVVQSVNKDGYTDSGATAVDTYKGVQTVALIETLVTDPAGVEAASVNTQVVGVYTVTYSAVDSKGNMAATTRSVSVVSPCRVSPSTLCVNPRDRGYGSCSACDDSGVCTCAVDLLYLQNEATRVVLEEYTPPVDTTPPVLTLRGDGQLALTSAGVFIMIHVLTIFSAWKDPGAFAFDDISGNITGQVLAWPDRTVTTAVPTDPDAPFVITYSVADAAGKFKTLNPKTLDPMNPLTHKRKNPKTLKPYNSQS
jgi:hypothetical protein